MDSSSLLRSPLREGHPIPSDSPLHQSAPVMVSPAAAEEEKDHHPPITTTPEYSSPLPPHSVLRSPVRDLRPIPPPTKHHSPLLSNSPPLPQQLESSSSWPIPPLRKPPSPPPPNKEEKKNKKKNAPPPPAPPPQDALPISIPPPPSSPPLSAMVVNRAERDETPVTTKWEGGGGNRAAPAEAASGTRRIVWPGTRAQAAGKVEFALRLTAVVECLVAFSVMAADKTRGWAGDSFDRYREYRFCIAVNIITFVYSGFQAYAYVHRLINKKHIIQPPFRYYFDFVLDQLLAYLLISAASAAASRNDDWVSNWGKDEFTVMVSGSISVSFLAFVTLSLSSLISAYNLFNGDL